MTAPFYAIRQISTGHFMPNYGSRKSRGGWTNDEPQPIDKGVPPRLFPLKRSAKIALKYWLRGVTNVTFMRSATLEGPDDSEYRDVTPKPHRKADDMEVVEISLEVIHRGT